MTSSPELLRYFHIEASDYVDAIEGIVSSSDAPDAGAFVAAARAMRGSATMARVPRIADLAFALEQIGNALREGELTWSVALQDELRHAVTDVRAMISAAAHWTAAEDQRAENRLAELRQFAPNDSRRPTPPASAASAAPIFIALQAAAIAADLETFVADCRNRALLDDVVSRVRSLRGIAGVADHPPLGDVADAVDRALRELAPDALLADNDAELFRAAAAVLRRASADLRARGRINLASGEIARFARATAAPAETTPAVASVVRIDELFYTDAGPHLVERGAHPPEVTAESRFRDEAVARAEHLRRLVADARGAADPVSRDRATRELRLNLQRLEGMARSFGAPEVASYFGELAQRSAMVDATVLDAVDAGARVLLRPDAAVQTVEHQLATVNRARRATPPTPPSTPPVAPTTAAGPGARRTTPPTPQGVSAAAAPAARAIAPKVPPSPPSAGASGKALRSMLESGIAGLRPLEDEPLSEPARLDDAQVVPVESLVYRGRTALLRAIEVRDEMRARGLLDEESLQELYDLLDLARTE